MAFYPNKRQKKFPTSVHNYHNQNNQSRFSSTRFTSNSYVRRVSGRQETVKIDERKFVYKVGGRMSWRRFTKAKQHIKMFDKDRKVMNWNAEGAKEAFFAARARFLAEEMGVRCGYDIPPLNPDLYTDNVDWNCRGDGREIIDDEGNDDPFMCISDAEGGDEDDYRYEVVNGRKVLIPESYFTPFDQVKATGWDDEDFLVPPTLTGMVVGGGRG